MIQLFSLSTKLSVSECVLAPSQLGSLLAGTHC